MAELREAVATREETVVDDVVTRMRYILKKEQKAVVLNEHVANKTNRSIALREQSGGV